MSWDPSGKFSAGSTVLLKGVWAFLGSRWGSSVCAFLAHRRDSRPPYLVKRLLYKMEDKWWYKLRVATGRVPETQVLSPQGLCSLGDNRGSGTISRNILWTECGALGTGLSRRTINTRAGPGIDAGSVCPHLQSQENRELSSSALETIRTCCPAWLQSKGQFGRHMLWIACHVYVTQSTLFSLGCALQSHLS